MSTELLDESPLYREWIATAEARGKAEGKAEGMRTGVLIALSSRFGDIDPALVQAINQMDSAGLEALIPHVAIDTLEQVRQWLSHNRRY